MINYTVKSKKSKELISKITQTFESVCIIERKRKFQKMLQFTIMMLHFINQMMSLRTLCDIFLMKHGQKITHTSFKKIFQKSDKFEKAYNIILNSTEISKKPKKILGNKECYLLDTTYLKEEGLNNEVYRIHTCYGLTKNQVSQSVVTDSHTAENVKNFKINENALYFADRAYGTSKQMQYMIQNKADFIFRFKHDAAKLYLDKKCTVRFYLSEYLTNSKLDLVSKVVYLSPNMPIRIVANRLPDDVVQKKINKTLKIASKMGRNTKQITLEMCQWFILATSLVGRFSSVDILKSYRKRWQIELHFKRFKSFLNFRKIRKSSKNYAFSFIYLALIFWFCLEQLVEFHCDFFNNPDSYSSNSLWTSFSVAFFTFLKSNPF